MEVSNGIVRLRLAADFGARITELTDLRTGRNWIVSGECRGATSDDANYIEAVPNGWDECFPTVAPCNVSAWGGGLRDHGALWGRPWDCRATRSGIVATYDDPRFRFRRAIRLAGDYVLLRYTLISRHDAPLPWLWSQHCLLACREGERIVASGIGTWRDAEGSEVMLGPVLGPDAGVAGKYFAPVKGKAAVALSGPQGGVEFSWRLRDAACVGLWFSYGGWPVENPLYQIGIEPASAPFGALSDAIKAGRAAQLMPGQSLQWQCRLRVASGNRV
ncbi:hypothetical protein [Celeribacter sp.]|uniref:hypothetical protein n=1 Tax=Celeribacter sp. TaxID=1890673 RepID=UPI003A936164